MGDDVETDMSPTGEAAGDAEKRIRALVADLEAGDDEARRAVRKELIDLGREATLPLIRALRHGEPRVRWEAANALGDIGDPRAAGPLTRSLEDSEADVRWAAADSLVQLGRAAIEPVLEALVIEPYSPALREVARHVLDSLYRKGHDGRLDRVREALRRLTEEEAIHVSAFEALQDLHEERGRERA